MAQNTKTTVRKPATTKVTSFEAMAEALGASSEAPEAVVEQPAKKTRRGNRGKGNQRADNLSVAADQVDQQLAEEKAKAHEKVALKAAITELTANMAVKYRNAYRVAAFAAIEMGADLELAKLDGMRAFRRCQLLEEVVRENYSPDEAYEFAFTVELAEGSYGNRLLAGHAAVKAARAAAKAAQEEAEKPARLAAERKAAQAKNREDKLKKLAENRPAFEAQVVGEAQRLYPTSPRAQYAFYDVAMEKYDGEYHFPSIFPAAQAEADKLVRKAGMAPALKEGRRIIAPREGKTDADKPNQEQRDNNNRNRKAAERLEMKGKPGRK